MSSHPKSMEATSKEYSFVGCLPDLDEPAPVDSKGRVSVPAEFRRYLPGASEKLLVIVFGGKGHLAAYPEDEFLRTYRKPGLTQEDLNTKAQRQRDMVRLTTAAKPPIDSAGRITIPKRLLEQAGITKSALFNGRISFIEIWEPETFRVKYAEALKREDEQDSATDE
jgi:division/cell wall cluster transcriptional repressor MraZ